MVNRLRLLVGTVLRVFRARRAVLLENLALRQQIVVLRRRRPRPRLTVSDRVFWILAHGFWSEWKQGLIAVTPETVVRWHRTGFSWHWSLISKVRKPVGRRPISKEVRDLLPNDGREPELGSSSHPRRASHVSERTICRWMKRIPRNPDPVKLARFSSQPSGNHSRDDFFTVPTVPFSVLYCFFLIPRHSSSVTTSSAINYNPLSLARSSSSFLPWRRLCPFSKLRSASSSPCYSSG